MEGEVEVETEAKTETETESSLETECTDADINLVRGLGCYCDVSIDAVQKFELKDSSDSGGYEQAFSERTLALIKPEAYEDAEAIEKHIRDHGFHILARREVKLTPEQAAELYKGHYGHHHFPHLVAHIASGPIVALVLATTNALQKWRTLMGPCRVAEAQAYWPDCLRACYGRRTKYGDYFNGLHGSESHAEAQREIHFFFPNMIVGKIPRHWQVADYIQQYITPTLLPALTALAHERPAEPVLWLAEHLRRHNPNEPDLAPQPTEQREEELCHTPRPSEESLRTSQQKGT